MNYAFLIYNQRQIYSSLQAGSNLSDIQCIYVERFNAILKITIWSKCQGNKDNILLEFKFVLQKIVLKPFFINWKVNRLG